MSIYLYDEALVEKLRSITGDNRIHVIPPDQSVSYLAQFDKDEVLYPAIVITRGSVSLTDTINQYAVLKGQSVRVNESDNTVSKIKLIPLNIEWMINVYAVDRYTCDEIVRELIFYFMTYPRFQIKVPYDLDVLQNFDIIVDPNIEDNSDLLDFPNTGEFYRETFSIHTENAHLYSSHRQYLTKSSTDVET